MFSVITNIYNMKTKGPTLMGFFTATGKLKTFYFFLTTRDVRCVHHVVTRHTIQVLVTHTSTCRRVCGKNLNSVPCHPWCTHRTSLRGGKERKKRKEEEEGRERERGNEKRKKRKEK